MMAGKEDDELDRALLSKIWKVRHERRASERGQKGADIYQKEADPFCFYLEKQQSAS